MKLITAIALTLFTCAALANLNYYPQNFQNSHTNLQDENLKAALFEILTQSHQRNGSNADTLGCDRNRKGSCYSHINLGYRGARKVLFGKLHLEQDENGYFIEDVYCQKRFGSSKGVGKNRIPNHTALNCEHTWPQSKFSGQFSKDVQKSDLHHLFPTESKANSVRGNYKFANVDGFEAHSDCSASQTEGHGGKFEPPTEHKGNVARAMFYFSVRYNIEIDHNQERVFREWHELDPVDEEEMERNDMILEVQNNRNPFIDYPHLVDQITNF